MKTVHLHHKLWLKSSLLAFLLAFVLLSFSGLSLLFFGWWQFTQVARIAQVSPTALLARIHAGMKMKPRSHNEQTTFLILGTDNLSTRGGVPPLTDTIILLTLNFKTGAVNLLPLPRDLWSKAYQTKINALYSYGEDHTPGHPEQFVSQTLAQLTARPIDYTLVINLDQLKKLIDILGGVEINVPVGFVDPQFPRTDVDITQVFNPQQLYETVSFAPGPQLMSSDLALKYIRSRHSPSNQGTDVARSSRQELVIQSIAHHLLRPKTFRQTTQLGQLLKLYEANWERYVPLTDLVAIGKKLWPCHRHITLTTHTLKIASKQTDGVIYHPAVNWRQPQWVYLIKDKAQFQSDIKQLLTQHDEK